MLDSRVYDCFQYKTVQIYQCKTKRKFGISTDQTHVITYINFLFIQKLASNHLSWAQKADKQDSNAWQFGNKRNPRSNQFHSNLFAFFFLDIYNAIE